MNILVFGAHPDDIEIGMGGTLVKFSKKGNNVKGYVATLPDEKEGRIKEAQISADILGIDIKLLDMNFDELYHNRKIVEIIDSIIVEFKPDMVFTHWNKDSHQDHNALTRGVIAATRKNNCSVYMYEQTLPGGIVPYSFQAQMFIDISNEIEEKLSSISAHKSQLVRNGDEWINGVKGRAMYRGNQINVKYAEAFQVIKYICNL